MNDLQVKTVEIQPAIIKTNLEDVKAELSKNLEKYQNLTFTEDSTAELRKVLAELRKGKQAVNRYRIDTKKELNKPVVVFEDELKELDGMFDKTITPLDKQLKNYIQREQDEKQKKVEEIRTKLIKEYELDDEYIPQVEILDQYLTKSASLKQVEESLEFQVKQLKMEQDQKLANIEIIKTNVKLANAEYNLSLSVDAYVRLLEIDSVEVVKEQIETDAHYEVDKRKREELEKQKKQEESKQFVDDHEVKGTITTGTIKIEPIIDDLPFDLDTNLPFGDIEDLPFDGATKRNVTLGIILTADQLEELQNYMDKNNIFWEVHADDSI